MIFPARSRVVSHEMGSARLRCARPLAWGLRAALALLASCGQGPVRPMTDAATRFGPSTDATCPTPAVAYADFGQHFFTTYCTRCHSATLVGSARTGAPDGYDFDSITGVRARIREIDEVAAAGPSATNVQMPFAGTRPSQAEREMLGQLLACGVPD